MGIASLVLGIISLVTGWIPFVCFFTFILAIIGLILGIVDTVKKTKSKSPKKGMSIAGLIISAISIPVIILSSIISLGMLVAIIEDVDTGYDYDYPYYDYDYDWDDFLDSWDDTYYNSYNDSSNSVYY